MPSYASVIRPPLSPRARRCLSVPDKSTGAIMLKLIRWFSFHLAARTPSERQNLTLIEHDSSPSSSISHAPPRQRVSFAIQRASSARLANEHYRQSPRYNGSFINRQKRKGQITAFTHPSLTVSLFLSGWMCFFVEDFFSPPPYFSPTALLFIRRSLSLLLLKR